MAKSLFSLKAIRGWQRSITGKITQFLLAGIVIAFSAGAFTNWSLVDGFSYQQWVQRAEANTQIMICIVRDMYTIVSVKTSDAGQISRIVSDRQIGDTDSIMQTGYNPIDVLALASVRTHSPTWLFLYTPEKGFVGINNKSEEGDGIISFPDRLPRDVLGNYYAGLAQINGEGCFISAVPILTLSSEILGSLVSSIGKKSDLYVIYDTMLKKNSIIFVLILLVALALVTMLIRRLSRPVLLLINSLTRIVYEETDCITPYLDQDDEIGHLAGAIERLRVAMKERGYLQRMHEMSREMERMVHHDSLTGLPDRVSFGQALDKRVGEIHQDERPLNLLLIDLDNFKPVNDISGHKAGDELLINIAQRLQLLLGSNSIVARLGGDEFAILQHISDNAIKEANRLAERITRALSIPFTWSTHTFSISRSIGITTTLYQGNNTSTLIINADLAMYASKHHGRGCFRFFEDGVVMRHTHSLFTNQEIIDGIDNKEFELYYQSIISLEDESVYGHGSLIRWNHPTKGLICPGYFINIVEDSGLIARSGEQIVRQSCEAATKWPERIRIAVNISAYQLHSPGLVNVIKDTSRISQLSAERLEIEIIESEKLGKSIVLPVLQEIRLLDIEIAVGDLGTGYVVLDYLLVYPFVRIKTARTLVDKFQQDNASQYLIVVLIQFAYKYNMSVTAEGVETAQQRDILRDIECQNVQDYFFSYPPCEHEVLSAFAKEVIEEGLCNVRLLSPGKVHADDFCSVNNFSNAMSSRISPAVAHTGANRQQEKHYP